MLLDDYRDLRGSYDKLVSIEMIEAVGWRDFGTFFARCSDLLRPDGAMLLQAITIDDRAYEVEKASQQLHPHATSSPNGCLPSLEVIARCVARHTDLRTVDLEDLTPHYAETLRRWRANVERDGGRARRRSATTSASGACGACTSPTARAGFAERRIGVVQTVLAKPHWRGSVRRGRHGAAAGGQRRSRLPAEHPRARRASSTNAGPREASFASAVLPPGPRMWSPASMAPTIFAAHSPGSTRSQLDVSA